VTQFTERDIDILQMKPRPKGTLPYLPDGRDQDLLRGWLTLAFRPDDGWSFDAFQRPTTERTDGCSIAFRNGRETVTYRFKRQGDLMGQSLRATVLSVSNGELDMPHLTGSEIEDVWAGMCKLGRVLTDYDERDETRKWVEQMLDATEALTGYTLVPDGRRDALLAIREHGEFKFLDAKALLSARRDDNPALLSYPIRFVDCQTGEQWLRMGETATYLRWVVGADPLSHGSLKGRLADIGVEARHFQDWHPPHPKAWLYRLTPELVEFVEGRDGGVDVPTAQPSSTST
jgi:hypothetical protein